MLPVDAWKSPGSPRGYSMIYGEDTYVKYGERVLLQHAKTGGHVTVRTSMHSESAPNCFVVDFGAGSQVNSADRWFRILPKYKIRQEGEHIRITDQVCLGIEGGRQA